MSFGFVGFESAVQLVAYMLAGDSPLFFTTESPALLCASQQTLVYRVLESLERKAQLLRDVERHS